MTGNFPPLPGESVEQLEARLIATLRERLSEVAEEALRGIATDPEAKPAERAEARSILLTAALARLEELRAALDELKKETDQ